MTFPPALPHGAITEVFDDIFMVTGGFRIAPGIIITRNMAIVRSDGELTLVNSVRLTDEGEKELDKLGRVKNLVRIGSGHGADDPYYVNRYQPTSWAPLGIDADEELKAWSSPISGTKVFLFERGTRPEAAIIVERNGGVLISCDSFQHWTSFEGCSLLGRWSGRALGFGPTVIGPMWLKRMGPAIKADFERLAEQPFKHLVPGHGAVLKGEAAAGLRTAMQRSFS